MSASGTNRVVVDWDGTCVEIAYPLMGDWLPDAPEALHSILAMGYDVVIFSTRLAPVAIDELTPLSEEQITREIATIRDMLDEQGLDSVQIWTRPWKPGGRYYIDDKAIPFKGDWSAVVKEVNG